MLPYGRKNPLPFPFSQRSHVGNLRQTIQGKGVIHKRVETAGVYPLVRPRGVSANPPPRGAARSRRPQTANPPLRFSGKLSARKGTNTLAQFEYPGQLVPKKKLPG